jgi:FtsH-binding integral membrane protein
MGFSYAPAPATTQVRTGVERATLARRTYGLVFLSVLVTMGGVAFAGTQPALRDAVALHPFLSFIAVLAPLLLAQMNARSFPRNVILTLLFTFVEGIFISPVLYYMQQTAPGAVGQAGILTFSAFGALSLYSLTSRRDFSAWGSFLTVGLLVLIVALIINSFVASVGAYLWLSAVGVLIFSGLLVFDTWRFMRSGRFGQDDYVFAAVQIYLDLLNMFMFILSLLGGGRRR